MTPTERLLSELNFTLRQVVNTNHELIRAHRANLDQWYDLKALTGRWCMGRDQVIDWLKREAGYVPASGQPVRIHLDHVLKIDELLRTGRTVAKVSGKAVA